MVPHYTYKDRVRAVAIQPRKPADLRPPRAPREARLRHGNWFKRTHYVCTHFVLCGLPAAARDHSDQWKTLLHNTTLTRLLTAPTTGQDSCTHHAPTSAMQLQNTLTSSAQGALLSDRLAGARRRLELTCASDYLCWAAYPEPLWTRACCPACALGQRGAPRSHDPLSSLTPTPPTRYLHPLSHTSPAHTP